MGDSGQDDPENRRAAEFVAPAEQRDVVQQATEILMASRGLDSSTAFETIVIMASEMERRVYDVARMIIEASPSDQL